MKDKYAGACWNQLMENETKESLAEMLMDSMDEKFLLKGELRIMQDSNKGLTNRLHVAELVCEWMEADFGSGLQDSAEEKLKSEGKWL